MDWPSQVSRGPLGEQTWRERTLWGLYLLFHGEGSLSTKTSIYSVRRSHLRGPGRLRGAKYLAWCEMVLPMYAFTKILPKLGLNSYHYVNMSPKSHFFFFF